MSSLTNKFRIFTISQFLESLSEGEGNSDPTRNIFYLYFSRCVDWDTTPETPVDAVSVENRTKREIFSLKRFTSSNINAIIPRISWAEGNTYDIYDSYTDISNKNFYVVNSSDQVFKCLHNGAKSTSATPNVTGSSANGNEPVKDVNDPLNTVSTPDGYIWKYIYTIPSELDQTFSTTNFIPVTVDDEVKEFSTTNAGIIESIKYIYDRNDDVSTNNQFNSGVFYTSIKGDGSGGIVEITVENINSFSVITDVNIVNGGSGYSVAFIDLDDVYSDVNLLTSVNFYPVTVTLTYPSSEYIKPMISPEFGHGYDPVKELYANKIMFAEEVSGYVANGNFPVDANVARYGIIKDPTNLGLNKLTLETYYAADAVLLENVVSATSGTLIQQNLDLNNDTVTSNTEIMLGVIVSVDVVEINGINRSIVRFYKTVDYNSLDNKPVYSINDVDYTLPIYLNNLTIPLTIFNYTGTVNNLDFTNGVATREYDYTSGELMEIENINIITRATDQTENIKITIEF